MGAVLGTLMGGVTMGATTTAINCVCFACPWGSSSVAKYLHLAILQLVLLMALLWSLKADSPLLFPDFTNVVECTRQESARYFGAWAIVLGLVLYHVLQALLLVGVKNSTLDKRAIIQNGGWPLKVFALMGCIASAFFIPPVFHHYFYYVAVAASVIFLALQSVYLVDFAYRGAELLVERYEETEGSIWKYSLFGITGLLYFVSLALSLAIMAYHQENMLLAILNILVTVVISVCSILERVQESNPQAGIFQAAIVSFYNAFLLTSSTVHEPLLDDALSGWKGTIHFLAGLFFAAGLYYYVATIGIQPDEVGSLDSHIEKGQAVGESSSPDIELEYRMSLFHIYMILAALFALVTIINWRPVELITASDTLRSSFKIGSPSLQLSRWSPIISSWLLSTLYMWSLFAPLIFPDRDFS